jgi:hypothetical protein
LLKRFNLRKRSVTGRWHIDETYIKVRGQWMYLYRAIDSVGDTVDFWFSEHRCQSARKTDPRSASNFDPLVTLGGERPTGWSWSGLRSPVGRVG